MNHKINKAYQYLTNKKPDGDCLITMTLMVEGIAKSIRIKQGMLEKAMQHGGLIVENAKAQKVRVPLTDENLISMSINGLDLVKPVVESAPKPAAETPEPPAKTALTEAKHPSQEGDVFEFSVDNGTEVAKFIEKYGLSEDIADLPEDADESLETTTYVLTPTASKEIAKAYDTFMEKNIGMDSVEIESMQAEVDGQIEDILSKLGKTDEKVTAKIEGPVKGPGYVAFTVSLKHNKHSQDWEPIGYFIKGDTGIEDAAHSWNWAAWLGIEDSPLYDSAWKDAYDDVEALSSMFLTDQDVLDLTDIITEWVGEGEGSEKEEATLGETFYRDENTTRGYLFRNTLKTIKEKGWTPDLALAAEAKTLGLDTKKARKLRSEVAGYLEKMGDIVENPNLVENPSEYAAAKEEFWGKAKQHAARMKKASDDFIARFMTSPKQNIPEAFRSDAQRRYFHWKASKKGKEGRKWARMTKEFEKATPKGADLPEKVNETLSVPDQHQLRIAKKTLSMHPAAIAVMGGPDHKEAIKILRTKGKWSDAQIKKELLRNGWNETEADAFLKENCMKEAAARFPVECLECGAKFMTASMTPSCPKCGGSDIDLVEKEPKQKKPNFELLTYSAVPKGQGEPMKIEAAIREEKVVEDSLIPTPQPQPTELPDYKDNIFAQLDAYAKKHKRVSFSEHLEIAPMSSDETIRHTSPFQTGNYIPRADLKDHFTWFVFVDDLRIATIEFSKAAHMLTTTTNVAPIKSIGADPYAFPMDNPPSIWGLVDVNAEQATGFIDHLIKTLDGAPKKMLGPEEMPENPALHGPESGTPTNMRE